MFGRWLNVRIKAAEKALRQGRIDDALAAALQDDVREHPRGQALIDGLIEPLTARARLHRQAGRYQDALADLDRVSNLGRGGPDVRTLRQRIHAELQQSAQRGAAEQAAYDEAADQLKAGRLETVRLNIDRVEDTNRRAELEEELDHRVQRGGQLLQQAAEMLDGGDVMHAVQLWQQAARHQGRTQATDRFAPRLVEAMRSAVDEWHLAGRLQSLLAARDAVAALNDHDATIADCQRLIDLCARATTQLSAADYAGLRQTMLKLKAARGDVAWVSGAIEALDNIAAGQEALMTSPIGLFASDAGRRVTGHAPTEAATIASPQLDAGDIAGDGLQLDCPLLMLVDGGGSSLLVGRAQVRIGRAGGSGEIDVPVPGDIESHHADITRHGTDYFLTAYAPTRVNRRPVQHVMLRDNDRISLGDSTKLTFHKPSNKSDTAVLRLSHRCRLLQDVSSVVLFRDTCLVGAGGMSHVRTQDDLGQVVLFERHGGLCARQTGGSGHLAAPVQPVVSGQTLEFGDLRMTIKPYAESGRKGAV